MSPHNSPTPSAFIRHEALPSRYEGTRSGIAFEKLSGYLGAEIQGLDLSKALSDAEVTDVHDAWVVHGVLVIRQQGLSAEEIAAFTERFGTLIPHPAGRFALEENSNVTVLSNLKTADEQNIGADRSGMQWHSDRSFRKIPAKGTFLYGVTCPPSGAATEFCSTYAAYETLPMSAKEMLSKLDGVHDYAWYWNTYQTGREPLTPEEAGPPVSHPVICTHPVTLWNVIYLSEGVTRTIEGMEEEEGRKLVLEYSDYCAQEQFRYAHAWAEGDLVMWDNLTVMHRATEFDNKYPRYMLRTQVEGQVPSLQHL